MIDKENYLSDPCRASSIPYYKEKDMEVPKHILIINDKEYVPHSKHEYTEELYFRLIHNLSGVTAPLLPEGFSLVQLNDEELSQHINSCYENISISLQEIKNIRQSEVYDKELIIAVKDDASGEIAASGIAVFDREINEGVLEWIQVSENYRRRGIGEFIVRYLLCKLKSKADFVTVSGKVYNKNNPEKLYRKCGFIGDNVWHVLWRK